MDLRTYWFDRRVPVSSILRHSCPQLLHFGLPFIKFDPDDLDGFFPSEGVDPLTHLVMFVPCETNHEYRRHRKLLTPWLQFRDKLIASMKHFRLTHLRIVFDYNFRSENDFIARDPANFMGDTDHHAAAITFFDAIPTLRYLFLTTCGRTFRPHNQVQSGARGIDTTYTWLSSKAWRVAEYPMHAGDQPLNLESGSTKSLIALSEEDAKRVVEREDLSLSSSEKDIVQECGDASTWGD
ncbi:hypothetical protein GSI_05795 [Ganoderma sinense ZZ0214-1]|uniref:Uncharacterized protein n=1 Tax=Ganoderma sinense ZZ0214-1 TaxID=1077348 RepID=A0A2G8SBG2_9APHY|nr:hypothetical protein GSI_05795 [Ganoderma sinense ZZ0214-1]